MVGLNSTLTEICTEMASKTLVLLAICSLGILASCSPAKEFPSKYSKDQIHFGQGGGFSGLITYYALLEDGRLFLRSQRDSTFTLVTTWDKNFVDQMFSNYKRFNFDQLDFNEPGDLYYFLQYYPAKKPSHNLTWGRSGFRPDENLVTYYNLLYKSTKSKT